MKFCFEGIHATLYFVPSIKKRLKNFFCHVSQYHHSYSPSLFNTSGSLVGCQPPIGNMPDLPAVHKKNRGMS